MMVIPVSSNVGYRVVVLYFTRLLVVVSTAWAIGAEVSIDEGKYKK